VLLEWGNLPRLVYKGQIMGVTLKFVAPGQSNIQPRFIGGSDVKLRYLDPHTSHDDLYGYKKIYFKITGEHPRLPDAIVADTRLPGVPLVFQPLHPPSDYSGVVAKKLELLQHKEVQFNKELNLVVMKIRGEMANLEDFRVPFAKKQHIKDINDSFPTMTILYYAFIPSSITKLRVSYFDSSLREFKSIFFDIVVRDQTVSTQSDINPNEDKNKIIKIAVVLTLSLLLLLWGIWKRSWIAVLAALAGMLFGGYLALPMKKVCVRGGSKIYILPTKNSTVFEINPTDKVYIKLNETNDYIKIKIDDQKVGWVKDEDLCQN